MLFSEDTVSQPAIPTLTLRPYQTTCVENVLTVYRRQPHGGKALIVLPTGGGKTIVFTEIARRLGLTTLIIAHRQELLQQAADKFRMVDPTALIGQVGAGRHEYGAPITVASVQTISRPEHLKALRRFGYSLVIIDECFPAGTLIDGKPIEQVQVGDLVTAYHEASHTFALKRVVRTFRRPVGSRLLKITAGTASVVCTPNHPFYTPSGWKSAQSLVLQEELLYVTSDPDHCPLHRMQPTLPPHNAASAHAMEARQEPVLLRRVQTHVGLSPLFRNNGAYQQTLRLRAYDAQQSDEERGVSTQDAANTSCYGPCPQSSQGQWNRTNGPSTSPDRASGRGLADGVRRQDLSSQDQPASRSDTLQTGYCQSSSDDWDRSRWNVPRESEPSGTGLQERAGAHWVRVDHIEVYEPRCDGTYGELCPDGYVYNFEVEDDHTYLANGFVVHNCHHSIADGYRAVLDVLSDAFVLGVTATPDRLDKRNIESIFGEPIFSASIIDMVEQGYLCDLRAIAVKTTTSLDAVHTQAGDFKVDELEEAVDTQERNRRVVDAYLEHCQERQALCFTVTVEHAHHLSMIFTKAGVRSAVVSGDMPADERKRMLHDYERGLLDVICNCGVLLEGFDHPQTSCVILARPTKSRALYTQAIGRGTRIAPGKRDCIILDITDNCLRHRIEPITLSHALGLLLQEGESITEAKARERQTFEREQQERITQVTQREHDLAVNILARMDWKRQRNGGYVLEVGGRKHRIFLLPSDENDGYYSVHAELAPSFTRQQWLKESPLTWAQEHAEMKARLLQSDEKKLVLVDSNAPWRIHPASLRQLALLNKLSIPHHADITSGEASDLIGREMEAREKHKAERKAARAAKASKNTQISKNKKAKVRP